MNWSKSILLITILAFSSTIIAQKESSSVKKVALDSNYITTFPNSIAGRIYLSRKYTNLLIERKNRKNRLNYEPNSTVNFGVGVTVKDITINLAYGFRFLNNNSEGRGKTRYLDLQTHIYKRKWIIDIFAQLYNGLYLNNTNHYTPKFGEGYYLRPDINVRLFGFTALRIKNSSKFSYAAPFVQNELQHKSAGSLLYGLTAIALRSSSDSNYIPSFIDDSLYRENYDVKNIQTLQLGPNIGYAYSLIIKKHFFITASATIALVVGPVQYQDFDNSEHQQWQVNPTFGARFAIGYNSPKKYLGLTILQGNTQVRTIDESAQASVGAGNIRLNYVKRFAMGPKLKKLMNKIP